MVDRWSEPRRLAAWAPDDARELLTAIDGGDELALARTTELFAKVFAVTSAWELARDAYESAAASRQGVRAEALREVAAALPLAPFATDGEAIAAELALVRAALDPTRPPAIAERAIVELRRSLAPRPVTARIEAAFGLAPEELALAMAAAAPFLDEDAAPLLVLDDWQPLIYAQTLGELDPARLFASGLVRATPELAPHPGFASRLLGRTGIQHTTGARLQRVEPRGQPPAYVDELARDLVIGGAIGVIIGPEASGRRTAAAHIARRRGRRLYVAHPTMRASSPALVEAALEVRLHDGVLALDLDAWIEQGLELSQLPAGPLIVVCRDDPAIEAAARAFTLYGAA